MTKQKISPEKKAMIKAEYDSGLINKRQLSLKYNCSYTAIQYILEPERTLAQIKKYKRPTEKNTQYCRNYREKKRQQLNAKNKKHGNTN